MTAETPDGYVASDDPVRLDLDAVHAYLTRSYWSPGVSRERVAAGSLCVGLYAPGGAQVGCACVVTDRAALAPLADVYVLEAHRGRGLGRSLVGAVLAHPDAHGLDRPYGFDRLAVPDTYMERVTPPAA